MRYRTARLRLMRVFSWKRIDVVQDVLCTADRAEATSMGLISVDEYEARVAQGIA